MPRLSKIRARSTALLAACVLIALSAAGVGEARADSDNISELAKTLETSDHHKARIAAAVSLGRLKDNRTLEPLVGALRDSHRSVRAVAAAALGHLGNARALPALQRATKDDDKVVRKRATEAIAAIRNDLAEDSSKSAKKGKSKAGFGRSAQAEKQAAPTMFLALKSTNDKSHGKVSDKVRKARANRLRGWMLAELARTPQVTLSKTKAGDLDLQPFNIDVSIVGFTATVRGPYVEIECKLRVAISNERGKMLSFLSGGAKVQVSKKSYRRKYLYRLQLEALENAVKGIHQDVISHLARLNHS